MAKPPLDKDYHGITIEVDGKKVGKIKSWDPKPIDEKVHWPKRYTEFLKEGVPSGSQDPNMHQVSFPVGSIPDLWGKEFTVATSGDPSHRLSSEEAWQHIHAQLEMWGLPEDGPVPQECWCRFARLLTDLGFYPSAVGVQGGLYETTDGRCVVYECTFNYNKVGGPNDPSK